MFADAPIRNLNILLLTLEPDELATLTHCGEGRGAAADKRIKNHATNWQSV